MTRATLNTGDTFEHKGRLFQVEFMRDNDMGEPWKEHDCHGIVSEWTTRDIEEGERLLAQDDHGRFFRYYDVEESRKKALRQEWCSEDQLTSAIEQDFEYLRDWCNDEWYWVGVEVTLLKADADAEGGYFATKHTHSVWGIESSADAYLTDVAYECADSIIDDQERTDDK